jgi:hypothetical protein
MLALRFSRRAWALAEQRGILRPVMKRILAGFALLLACGGRAERLDSSADAPPEMPSRPLSPVQPPALSDDPGQVSIPPVVMMPQTPMMTAPVTPTPMTPPMQPEPPVMMPDPSVTPPAHDPVRCGVTSSITFTASEQSTVDQLAGCEELYGLQVLAPLDLRPLATLRRAVRLDFRNVETLTGLETLEQVGTVDLQQSPVTSLMPLSQLRSIEALLIVNTGLVGFAGLENARRLTTLYIQENVALDNLNGLILEDPIHYVALLDNPALRDVTSLSALRHVQTELQIARNPQLTELPAFSQLAYMNNLLISENAALQTVPDFAAITQIIAVEIWNNPALERLTFSALEYLGRGFVAGNASLVEVSLPRLNSVGTLSIHDNQQLDGVALSQSLADIPNNLLRVAPDQTQSQLDPCPWTTDDVCDESGLCAPGTDPVCSQF